MQHPHHLSIVHSQNFLRSSALVDRLLDASSIQPGDLVFDLGAGTGLISRRLARRGCEVVGVERDQFLVAGLQLEFAEVPNVRVRHSDIVDVDLPRRAYKVFSNIPFNLTAEIVGRLTTAVCTPEDAYLVIQREAAERFIGKPRGTLAAALLFPWFDATVIHEFSRTDFAPAPRVDVVMLRLHKRGPPLLGATHAQLFRDFVVCLFNGRSPSLGKRLSRLLGWHRGRRLARALDVSDAMPSCVPPSRWLELFNATVNLTGDELRWRVGDAERRLRRQQCRLQKLHRTQARHLRPPPRMTAIVVSRIWSFSCRKLRPEFSLVVERLRPFSPGLRALDPATTRVATQYFLPAASRTEHAPHV